MSDDPTNPTLVTLFVVAEQSASDVNHDLWQATFDSVSAHAHAHGIPAVGPDITTLWDMSAADYLTSAAVSNADSS